MSRCFIWFPFVELGEPNYITNRFVLQELEILLGRCLTLKNWWWLVTGDDGVGFGEINTAQINVVQLLRIY